MNMCEMLTIYGMLLAPYNFCCPGHRATHLPPRGPQSTRPYRWRRLKTLVSTARGRVPVWVFISNQGNCSACCAFSESERAGHVALECINLLHPLF